MKWHSNLDKEEVVLGAAFLDIKLNASMELMVTWLRKNDTPGLQSECQIAQLGWNLRTSQVAAAPVRENFGAEAWGSKRILLF